jgi:hypothetical protein
LSLSRVPDVPRGTFAAEPLNDGTLLIVHAAYFDPYGLVAIDVGADTFSRVTIEAETEIAVVSLAIDPVIGRPHIAIRHASGAGGETVRAGYRQEGDWFFDTVKESDSGFPFPSIAVDGDGLPWVVYTDVVFGSVLTFHYDRDEWIERAIDDSGEVGAAAGFGPAVVVLDDRAHIAFSSSITTHPHLAIDNGTTFDVETIDDTVAASTGLELSSFGGELYVGFGGGQVGGEAYAMMGHRTTAWSTQVIDNSAPTASAPIVRTGPLGIYALFLSDGGVVARLAFLANDAEAFVVETVSSDGPFVDLALMLDADGRPIVVLAPNNDDGLLLAR